MTPTPTPTPTLRDVASRAEVSLATVSRVLNGITQVDPVLTQRVQAAAEELGYRANLLARGLRRQRTDVVGMVVPQIANPFFSALMQAVSRRLQAADRTVLLADSENDPDLEARVIVRLVDHGVDGILLTPASERIHASATAAAAGRTPLVLVDRVAAGPEADTVTADQRGGVDAVIAHLGRGRSPFTRLVSAATKDSVARERAEAYAAAVADGRVRDPHPPLLGTFTAEWGRQATAALLDQVAASGTAPPDALVCGNDLIALGALAVLARRGLHVPEDIAVTGFDDVGLVAVANPPLTTVAQPLEALADTATTMLDSRLQGDDGPSRHERLPCQLVVRASTGGAR